MIRRERLGDIMYVVTNEQMRKIDGETISRHEPGIVLMERAGKGVVDAIDDYFDDAGSLAVSIFLGKGNNAGDGLVVARILADMGADVALHYMHSPDEFSPDAFKNHSRLEKRIADNDVREAYIFRDGWKKRLREELNKCDLIVDALLGTGISSPVRENYAEVIGVINDSGLPVISIDIPSGINGTDAEVMGCAVRADMTVTMAFPKYGNLFYPGKAYSGGLDVVDIGVPPEIADETGLDVSILDFDSIAGLLPERPGDAHKFACGSLLVIAGSRKYSGAAVLSSLAALRTGCGIVYAAGPESIRPVIQSSGPEIIFIPLPETEEGSVAEASIGMLAGNIRYDAVAIGPGMTTVPETESFIKEFIGRCQVPMVVDADGLNAFEGEYEILAGISKGKEMVLTPHSGELRRLTGEELPKIPLNRLDELTSLVEGTGLVMVHKGAPTVIAAPDGNRYVNIHGHPGQATAGSGDVLTGTIGGLMAQGGGAVKASMLGVYLHSRAAEIAACDMGERGMTAGDCLKALPLAVCEIEEAERGISRE